MAGINITVHSGQSVGPWLDYMDMTSPTSWVNIDQIVQRILRQRQWAGAQGGLHLISWVEVLLSVEALRWMEENGGGPPSDCVAAPAVKTKHLKTGGGKLYRFFPLQC